MSKRVKTAHIPLNPLRTTDLPINKPFMEAYIAYLKGQTFAEPQTVCAGKIRVPELAPIQTAFVKIADFGLFTEMRRTREERMTPVPVLERADGSLWAYDDAAYLSLFHRFAPAATVRVVVIGSDPA